MRLILKSEKVQAINLFWFIRSKIDLVVRMGEAPSLLMSC